MTRNCDQYADWQPLLSLTRHREVVRDLGESLARQSEGVFRLGVLLVALAQPPFLMDVHADPQQLQADVERLVHVQPQLGQVDAVCCTCYVLLRVVRDFLWG